MEKSFDLSTLLRNNEKKHKSKPSQFISVAGGVKKRLETNIKNRKSSRLTVFDSIRNLPICETPDKVSEAKIKIEYRRQQLEKWKLEKEKKKKEQAAQKKKPFVAGVPHAPLKFVLPPPLPKPSTSGRVTRSQSAKSAIKPKSSPKQSKIQSFAPKNASFRPPEIKTLSKLPTLAPLSKTKSKRNAITFEPAMPKSGANLTKQTRSRTVLNRQTVTETKNSRAKPQVDIRSLNGKIMKKPSPGRVTKTIQSSSSGSDIEPSKVIKRIKTPGPRKGLIKETKILTPKVLLLESTSEEKSSSEEGSTTSENSSGSINVVDIGTDSLSSESKSSVEEQATIVKRSTRKSVPNNFSPYIATDSSVEKLGGESETSVILNTPSRKSLPDTPKNKVVPKSESSSEEKLRSPKLSVDLPLTPEQIEFAKRISPCVTLSRGKDNARKEMKWKMDEGLLDYDSSDMDGVDHFRRQLATEIKRMTGMCDVWDKVLETTVLPESIQEAVLAAVGQARLLMSQKLQQFASLVERCARPDPAVALVTPADLHGFWDMVFMQVENVDMRFKKLEELRARGWVEDKPVEQKKVKKVNAAKKPAKATVPSRMRDVIAAARRAKKEQVVQLTNTPTAIKSVATPTGTEKTFEAGFFCVRSPVRSPVRSSARSPARSPATPRHTLLKAVLSSEAKKASASKNSASLAMLRASILGKNVECEGVAPLEQTPKMSPINLYATPGRSILKTANVPSSKRSGKKSIKLVLFSESDHDLSFMSLVSEKDNAGAKKEAKSNKKSKIPNVVEEREAIHNNSGVASINVEKNLVQKENKERAVRPKLSRQDAICTSPSSHYNCIAEDTNFVMTRSRRKSVNTPKVENKVTASGKTEAKTSSRKKKPVEEGIAVTVKTPRQSARTKKTVESDVINAPEAVDGKTTKRTTRKKALQEVEVNIMEENVVATPKRSSRRHKSAGLQDLMT